MSKSIFTDQQKSLLKEAKSECTACAEKLRILRGIGFPNEVFEETLMNRQKTVEAALELDRQYQEDAKAV